MTAKMGWAIHRLTGHRTDIAKAKNGLACNCICAVCSERVVAVQGKTGKRVHHFRHHAKSSCAGPSPHDLAVTVLHHRLDDNINVGLPAMASYTCECGSRHSVNLLELNGKARLVEREKRISRHTPVDRGTKPDVTVVAEPGRLTLCEVVYSHHPDPDVLAHGFPVLVIPVGDEKEALALDDGLIQAGRLFNFPCPTPNLVPTHVAPSISFLPVSPIPTRVVRPIETATSAARLHYPPVASGCAFSDDRICTEMASACSPCAERMSRRKLR